MLGVASCVLTVDASMLENSLFQSAIYTSQSVMREGKKDKRCEYRLRIDDRRSNIVGGACSPNGVLLHPENALIMVVLKLD